jgi:hypothetical protein
MLADYLNQTVTYEQFHSPDIYGDPSYNTPVSLPARVSYRQKKVYSQTGDEISSFCHVTVEREVTYDDRITLSDGVKRVPLALRHARNADGTIHHTGVDL